MIQKTVLFFFFLSCGWVFASQEPQKTKPTSTTKATTSIQVLYVQPKAKQLTSEGNNGECYFSPDGSKLIFQSKDRKAHKHYQIYVYDLKRQQERRITHHDGDNTCSYFHPNGKGILYASTVDEVKESHKYERQAPSWVAKHLLLRQKKEASGKKHSKAKKHHKRKYKWAYKPYEIYSADLDGKNTIRLTHATGYDAEGTYSPDGKSVIFSSRRDGDQELYVMNADGTSQKRLTWRKGNDGGAFVSPSHQKVTWRSFDKRGNSQIMVADWVNQSLKNIKQLTFKKAIHWAPFWHPSEKWILFSANHYDKKNFDLYVVNVEGTCMKRVTYSKSQDVLPVFSPDGKQIAYTSRVGKTSQLYIMDFVMPPDSLCEDPHQNKTKESLLDFTKKTSKHSAHSYKHYYRHYKKHSKTKPASSPELKKKTKIIEN